MLKVIFCTLIVIGFFLANEMTWSKLEFEGWRTNSQYESGQNRAHVSRTPSFIGLIFRAEDMGLEQKRKSRGKHR
jgi:hypothetical protein